MKKFVAILLAMLLILVFGLINSSFEPLPEKESQSLNILLVTIYSIVVLGISIYFHKHRKNKNYITETENLPSPVLAEAIIDGKIGVEELIFSSIVDFTLRKNIKSINEDTFELVNTNHLTQYEQSILELIFQGNNIMHISKLNDILINSSEKINEIKEKILEELYEKNIFNYLLTKINKFIGIISLFILINLPLIFKIANMWVPFALLDLSLCIYYYRKYIKKQTHDEIILEEYLADKYGRKRPKRLEVKFYIIIGYIAILGELFNYLPLFFRNNIVYFVLMLVNICINIYIISKSNYAVFTLKGKTIRNNLQKLKNYIKDYNIISEEKIKSVSLWDKYVAYAIAFRILKNIPRI